MTFKEAGKHSCLG